MSLSSTLSSTSCSTPCSTPSHGPSQPVPPTFQPLDVFEVITWHCTGKPRALPERLTTPRSRVLWPDLDDLGPVEWLDALPGSLPSFTPAAQP